MSTNIEWATDTLNPVIGCSPVSPGCKNCYACPITYRLGHNPKLAGRYTGLVTLERPPQWTGEVRRNLAILRKALHWRRPRRIFVNSMSDWFHPAVPLAFLQEAFGIMQQAHWHQFLILTKRARRLVRLSPHLAWPPNVWMGVSVEESPYRYRLDRLRQVPAALRFVSCEPLLGPLPGLDLAGIGWLIVGAESGPAQAVRPMDLAWVRDLRDQCQAAGVLFFFKQDAVRGHKHPLPLLDGRQWAELPPSVYQGHGASGGAAALLAGRREAAHDRRHV